MNNICPICGCKTEELDFSDCTLGTEIVRACSYCRKQLGIINSAETLTEQSVRWIDNVLLREAPERNEACTVALKELRASVPAEEPQPAASGGAARPAEAQPAPSAGSAREVSFADLEERLSKVEHDFYAFKRRLFLMNIAEIVVPVILLIILVIIFLNSGIMDSLRTIISAGTGGAVNYSGGLNLFGRITAFTIR